MDGSEIEQNELIVVLSTFPSEEVVRQIGTKLVEMQLIACINILPKIHSIYQWEGKLCEEAEYLGIMKTTQRKFPELERVLSQFHPYETPEIVALNAAQVNEPYLAWVCNHINA